MKMISKIFIGLYLLLLAVTTYAASNEDVAIGALTQVGKTLIYDPSYVKLTYPGGDVSIYRGVCADVVIRALRHTGQDLQKLVHQDMKAHFNAYPKAWGLKHPDPNIDHRRVLNLEVWFKRHSMALPLTKNPKDYKAGDIVTWRLDNGMAHIGVVIGEYSSDGVPLVVHNIGWGTLINDVLFDWKMIGHYRFYPN